MFFFLIQLGLAATNLTALPLSPNWTQEAAPAKPQQPPPVVVLDPAHGGADSGARGAASAVESEIVLDFARAIRVALEGQGLRAVLTREGNEGPTLDARSAIVNTMPGAIFISLHVSSTGPAGTVRTYWYAFPHPPPDTLDLVTPAPSPGTTAAARPAAGRLIRWDEAQRPFLDASRHLAESVQTQLAQKFGGSDTSPQAVGVRQLRTVGAPAIALEVSSVAVSDPQQLLQMGPALAQAVARGVADYRATENGLAANAEETR